MRGCEQDETANQHKSQRILADNRDPTWGPPINFSNGVHEQISARSSQMQTFRYKYRSIWTDVDLNRVQIIRGRQTDQNTNPLTPDRPWISKYSQDIHPDPFACVNDPPFTSMTSGQTHVKPTALQLPC